MKLSLHVFQKFHHNKVQHSCDGWPCTCFHIITHPPLHKIQTSTTHVISRKKSAHIWDTVCVPSPRHSPFLHVRKHRGVQNTEIFITVDSPADSANNKTLCFWIIAAVEQLSSSKTKKEKRSITERWEDETSHVLADEWMQVCSTLVGGEHCPWAIAH